VQTEAVHGSGRGGRHRPPEEPQAEPAASSRLETRPGSALRHALVGICALALVLAALLVGGFFLLENRYGGNIDRVSDVFAGVNNRPAPVTPAQATAEKPVTFLLMGSDTRAHPTSGTIPDGRSDVIMLVRFAGDRKHAQVVSIPRDSWVDIPGVGNDKINASLYYGGPQLLGETVGNLIGIQPDYVFVTRFEKFRAMIGTIGGIEVDNPIAFDDYPLKPDGFPAGKIHLGPWDALFFSRIRHNLLRGDFDRSANQQRVLRGIQAKIRQNAGHHGFIEKGVLSAMQNMATNASPAELYRLARAAAAIDPAKITNCVLQGGIGDIGGASVVLPYFDQAQEMGDLARDDATLEHCPGV
jgi:LCP family protein required for cell wall assembly